MTSAPQDPRKLPQQERSRVLVDAILDAAARILARQGREALTTNLVAAKAGVSIGSLYQYFPNREAVIAAVATRHAHRVFHLVADLDLSAETQLDSAVARIAGSLFAAHRLDPELHAALDGDFTHAHGDAGHVHHSGTKDAMATQLIQLPPAVREQVQRSDFALAAMTVAEIVHAMAHAAIVHPHVGHPVQAFEQEAVRAAVAYLRASD